MMQSVQLSNRMFRNTGYPRGQKLQFLCIERSNADYQNIDSYEYNRTTVPPRNYSALSQLNTVT